MINRGALEGRFDAVYNSPSNKSDIVNNTIYPIKRLSEVANLQRGRFSHRPRNEPRFYTGVYPFIQTGDIVRASQEGGEIQFSQTLNELGLSVSKLFQPNIIVMTIAANIGDTAILTYPACFPDSLVAITTKTTDLDLEYLNIYLSFLKDYLDNLAPQAAQKNINLQQLSPTPVVIPPLEIQKEIVNIFQAAYDSKRQKEAEAKEMLASIDAYLLKELGIETPKQEERKLFFYTKAKEMTGNRWDSFYYKDEFQQIEIGVRTSKYPITNLGKYLSYVSYGASIKNEYVDEGIPFLRISDLKRNEINVKKVMYLPLEAKKELGNCFVYEDDFLISRSGTTGVVSIVPKNIDGFAYGSFMIKFRLKEESPIDKFFLSYYLNSELMQKVVERNRIGAIQGNITIPTIKAFQIPLPPLEKQEEIAAHISAIRAKAKVLEQEAAELIAAAKAKVEEMILGV